MVHLTSTRKPGTDVTSHLVRWRHIKWKALPLLGEIPLVSTYSSLSRQFIDWHETFRPVAQKAFSPYVLLPSWIEALVDFVALPAEMFTAY